MPRISPTDPSLRAQRKLYNPSTGAWETAVTSTEYESPHQHGGIYGVIYRQYFLTSLPSNLTSGNNVSALIDYGIIFNDSSNRALARGNASYSTSAGVDIRLTGTSGNGNLLLGSTDWTIIEGWVDYIRP